MSRTTLKQRCTAHTTQTKAPCKRWALHGATVCTSHGARAPQVKASAEERIKALVHPALLELERLITLAESDSVKLSAVKDVLDRAGYKPREKTDLTVAGGLAIYLPERTPLTD